MINWSSLDLNPQQENEIDRLESQWQRTYSDVYPQIQRDKNELRHLLNAPQSNERQIMELQNRIQQNEQRLRQEATRTFLNKKGQLNPAQKVRLQQMMGR
jgi:Spy/CpxP family protein refolding chaperone